PDLLDAVHRGAAVDDHLFPQDFAERLGAELLLVLLAEGDDALAPERALLAAVDHVAGDRDQADQQGRQAQRQGATDIRLGHGMDLRRNPESCNSWAFLLPQDRAGAGVVLVEVAQGAAPAGGLVALTVRFEPAGAFEGLAHRPPALVPLALGPPVAV